MWALPAHAVGPFDGDTEVQAPIDFLSTERSMHAIRDFVRWAAEVKNSAGKNVMPVIIGGDQDKF